MWCALGIFAREPDPHRVCKGFVHARPRSQLRSIIVAKATHLLTVDKKHFGFMYGGTVDGVLITTPGDYLRQRSKAS